MSKWLESLGFGAQKPKRKSSPAVARIRETMRWRGYDLSAYSDDEIDAARIELGEGVSETGETTHASREALAALLRERRERGISPESALATRPVVDSPPVVSPGPVTAESPPAIEVSNDEPASPADAKPGPRWDEPGTPRNNAAADGPQNAVEPAAAPGPSKPGRLPRAAAVQDAAQGYKPAPGRYKSPLLLGLHGFGLHSWKFRDDPPGGPRMRCDGCGKERPAGRNARPAVVAPVPVPDRPAAQKAANDAASGDEPRTFRPEEARNAWSNDRSIDDPGLRSAPPPRPASPRPRQGSNDAPSLFQRFMGSPWWVKTMAIFFLLQVVGMVASLFSGGTS